MGKKNILDRPAFKSVYTRDSKVEQIVYIYVFISLIISPTSKFLWTRNS